MEAAPWPSTRLGLQSTAALALPGLAPNRALLSVDWVQIPIPPSRTRMRVVVGILSGGRPTTFISVLNLQGLDDDLRMPNIEPLSRLPGRHPPSPSSSVFVAGIPPRGMRNAHQFRED
ncbi:hypothetical protein GALMADRAFT_131502 [Galerina marginata CBS 339.88]|uniref:Uncharacterized protein n=1 Tax=Galerina marginata (strain CBS 339.88) TaxID=685588 RepID=A0A067TN93_GALM3|nr:hypothetical protein GALMADRAFT_131502 [Galerina marginata CBS 339.88]